jgi:predicted metal-dependent hydrolase
MVRCAQKSASSIKWEASRLSGALSRGVLACYDRRMSEERTVRIVRSDRRQKTVAARWVDGGQVLEVLAPSGASDAELGPIIDKLKRRLEAQRERAEIADDAALRRRAQELNRQYFGGKLSWSEIRYVTNQSHRYGSCTPAQATIRISHRVASMPNWVRDYVIMHELAHLVEANHGARFWKLVNKYPRTERARGFLIALGMEGEGEESTAGDLE